MHVESSYGEKKMNVKRGEKEIKRERELGRDRREGKKHAEREDEKGKK